MLEAIRLISYSPEKVADLFPEVSAVGLCNSKGELPDDHCIFTCLLEMRRPGKIKEERVFRFFREINIVDFKDDLRKSLFPHTVDESSEVLSAT